MPYDTEHAARQKSPQGFQTFRRKSDKGGPGVDFIFGIKGDGKTELQSVRFDAERFTANAAKKWLDDHNMAAEGLESAKEMVENRGAGVTLEHILTNATGCNTRFEELEGKRYLVAPMVMLTEGVHRGSKGPLYYPPEELSKTPAVWNTKPIVVYHPNINGAGVSACTPEILSSSRVGMVMGARYEDGKLKAEAWLDDEKMDRVDPRIRAAIQNKQVMEISTGLFTDNVAGEGDWRGERYTHTARNYRPDHLALLPDEAGACSVADGAGLLRNNENGEEGRSFVGDRDDTAPPPALLSESRAERIHPVQPAPTKSWFVKEAKHTATTNAAAKSHRQVCHAINNALQERFGRTAYVEDVYPKFFVYCRQENGPVAMDGPKDEMELYKLGYTMEDGKAVLSNESPEEVMRVMEYQTKTGDYVANTSPKRLNPKVRAALAAQPFLGDDSMPAVTKETVVDALIANAATAWDEDDREFLLSMDDSHLEKIVDNADEGDGDGDGDGEPAEVPDAAVASAETPAQVAPAQNAEQYIAAAPPGIREVLRSGLESYNAQKRALISQITANKANKFHPKFLETQDVQVLQGMAALAAPVQNQEQSRQPVPVFGGAATPAPTLNTAPVQNKDSKPLIPARMEFAEVE